MENYFIILSIVLFLSCDQDVLEPENSKLTPIERIQASFQLDEFEDPAGQVVGNIKVNWKNYSNKMIQDVQWYEFEVIETSPTNYEEGLIKGYNYTLLGNISDQGVPTVYLNKMISYSDGNGNTYFDIEKDFFHGVSYLYNTKGKTYFLQHFQKGQMVSQAEDDNVDESIPSPLTNKVDCYKKTSLVARCNTALQCALDGGSNGGSSCGSPGSSSGGYRTVTTHHYTDWYNVRSNGTKELSNVQYNGSTTEYVWISNTSSYGAIKTQNYAVQSGFNRISHSRYKPSNTVNRPKDIIMDKTMKRTKVLCAYQRLSFQNNGLFKKTIGKFKGDADYDLLFTVKKMPKDRTSADAVTINNLEGKGFVEIRINPSNANGNPLEMAQLLLHEGIHAEIHRYVQEKKSNADIKDRPRLMQLYQYYIGLIPAGQASVKKVKYQMTLAQHNYMAEKYVKPIAEALRKFDNNRYPVKDYMGLSWEGLKREYHFYGRHTEAQKSQFIKDSQKVLATYKNDKNAPCN